MIRDIKSEGGVIVIISDKGQATLKMEAPIGNVLKFDNSVVVRTAGITQERARNIHRFDEKGKKIWTVEEPEGVKGQANAFMDLWLTENGELWGGAWSGLAHQIDFETGNILSTKLTK